VTVRVVIAGRLSRSEETSNVVLLRVGSVAFLVVARGVDLGLVGSWPAMAPIAIRRWCGVAYLKISLFVTSQGVPFCGESVLWGSVSG